MYDADVTTLMTAFPLDENRARDWFAAIRTAYEADPAAEPPDFAERLRAESAGIVDPTDVDLFLETLEQTGGDQMSLIARLAELEPELADVHRSMTSAAAEDAPFDWVPADQADQLAAAWGPSWQDLLGEQLDYRWGAGWEANPAEHKATWLPDVVAELLAQDATGPAEPTTEDIPADVRTAIDEVLAEVPGAENLTEAELQQIAAEVAAAVASENQPA